jgi:hypothetical protein
MLRFEIAAVVALLVAVTIACGHPRPVSTVQGSSLSVRVVRFPAQNAASTVRTFVVKSFRVSPRPAMPTEWLARTTGNGGMTAMAARETRSSTRPWIFVLVEPTAGPPAIRLFPVSPWKRPEPSAAYKESLKSEGAATPPCVSWSAFFLKGIGDLPSKPVALLVYQNDGPSRSMTVDPARYTFSMRPVLRFSTRDVKELRQRDATFVLGLTMTAGSEPFLLLGIIRRPDGSYSESLFSSSVGHDLGWGPFANKLGEVTDVSFYALDDSRYRSACRTH